MNEHEKHLIDFASISNIAFSLVGMLPSIAAGFSILWTIIRIYETKTFQKLLGKDKQNDKK